MTSEHDDMLDRNLSRLLSNGAERPALDPDRRADMLDALLARQAELRPAKETTMAPSPWRKRLLIAAATAAAVLAVWLGFPRLLPPPAEQPEYTVKYGENANQGETISRTLADGTIVISKPGTEFAVGEPRFLYLTQGDLYLIVAKSDAPFVVHSKHGMAIAHGTRFAASVDDSLRVAVAQGTVTVKNDEGSVDVGVGQETEARSGQAPTRRPAPRLSYVVNWAREKLAQAKRLVPKSEQTGALVAQDPWGQEAKLSLRKYHVDVHIEDGIARTTVDQTFFNHLNWNTEGTFTFPLPPGASVSRLAMYVGGALNEGGMVERSRGQAIYTEIKFQRRDPALLEMMEGNVFKLRIFPLEGRREKRIFLSYTQKLDELYGTMRYWFPM
ncbi:FecR domain-containing protein, partial [bacterium]|nr:FecR domain-containing protein [bacterium]